MIHNLTMGHFDADELRKGKLVVLRSLDMGLVSKLLHEMGEMNDEGQTMLGGCSVDVRDGYVVCRWLVPRPNRCVEAFARQLQQRTGCLLADVKRREIVSLEQVETGDACAPVAATVTP
jgi:hypothetical protein